MSKILCGVEHTVEENEEGVEVESVIVTCPRCGHVVKSWGYSENSLKRSCAMMHQECPKGENNFYIAD